MTVIFTLRLDEDGSSLQQYFRLPPPLLSLPYSLKFVITAGSLASIEPVLYTNVPVSSDGGFERTKYHGIPFQSTADSDHTAIITIRTPGSFEFYVEYEGKDGSRTRSRASGYFVVDPLLMLETPKKQLLPLDGITILTIIPKWMPTLSQWMPFFKSFAKTGYNMVHFAPINKRGASNSPYSINDQLSISDDLFDSPISTEHAKYVQMKSLIQAIHKDCNIFSATDIVWNHTSCDSEWLQDHPEAGYNLQTAPYLRSAVELDQSLIDFSGSLAGKYVLNSEADLEIAMNTFKDGAFNDLKLYEFYVLNVKSLEQQFTKIWKVRTPLSLLPLDLIAIAHEQDEGKRLVLIKAKIEYDPKSYTRYSKTIDFKQAIPLFDVLCRTYSINDEKSQVAFFVKIINDINVNYYKEYDEDCGIIMNQIQGRARFLRLEHHGPRLGPITQENPIVDTYFTRLPENEKTKKLHPDQKFLANNGWIWNADPLVNFAGEGSKAYLRREVIGWGDCVKLRYGNGPEDNPWLWKHQTAYTVKMAELFHGFRIDNCHSTPIHVATRLLDEARKVNQNLYVFAELFTGSEEKDIVFVSKLGINSLIREAMNAWDPVEMSRLVHRQGGSPIGSFTLQPHQFPLEMLGHNVGSNHYHPSDDKGEIMISIKNSSPHSLFMDCTHDNETPYQKRTAIDTLSNAALVAMSTCAVGSVKGYDEIVPFLLDVVGEKRKYRLPKDSEGIIPVKSVLYPLHAKLASMGFSEIHVHQEHDYISVHRMHPITHDGYLTIVRTAFKGQSQGVHSPIHLRNQHVRLIQCASIEIENGTNPDPCEYRHQPGDERTQEDLYPQPRSPTLYHPVSIDDIAKLSIGENAKNGYITGLRSKLKLSDTESFLTFSRIDGSVSKGDFETVITIDQSKFIPGSVVIFRTWVAGCSIDPTSDNVSPCSPIGSKISPDPFPGVLEQLWLSLGLDDKNFGVEIMSQLSADILDAGVPWCSTSRPRWLPGLRDAVKNLRPAEINVVLFRTAPEDYDSIGQSLYEIPGFGSLVYCGLQGIVSAVLPIARKNDLGHPICSNMRQGPWLYDYTIRRLEKYLAYYPGLKPFYDWLHARIELIKKITPSFAPKYFAILIMCAYEGVKHQALCSNHHSLVPPKANLNNTSSLDVFAYNCALTAFQCYGSVKSTGLLPGPYPLPLRNPDQNTPVVPVRGMPVASLAAGLPHFSTEYTRCWGRDIFIALRGLFLIPGDFEAARTHILAFGSTLKHGMIPNLLDQGIRPRYNARDATWFWLDAVFCYCKQSPEGLNLLKASVARRFIPLKRYTEPKFGEDKPGGEEPNADDYIAPDDKRVFTYTSTIAQLCHEIFERHFAGIDFREWNAGSGIDHAMRSEGFQVNAFIDRETGFVKGGNRWNCGTWMDKMGDSGFAGNLGVPATPRDGSDIELVGLQKSALNYINNVILTQATQLWPWKGVYDKDNQYWSYSSWSEKIQNTFEKAFYIPKELDQDKEYWIPRSDLVNRRGIYKDTFGSCTPFADYQLRPNSCIAMIKAPELFNSDHCRASLLIIKEVLVGPIGIKTLDPSDWAYRGVYDNRNESNDPTVAHGFNYHQGPEWVWVLGYFLRAYLYFFTVAPGFDKLKVKYHINEIQKILKRHKIFLLDYAANPFAGLPELTNQEGAFCGPSCPTQAWSTSVMIELVMDLRSLLKDS